MQLRVLLMVLILVLGLRTIAFSEELEQILWIDVRTVEEYEQGHLQRAINISHDHISENITDIAVGKHDAIYLYCRSSNRANLAKRVLEGLGYTAVEVKGGYEDLKKQGYK